MQFVKKYYHGNDMDRILARRCFKIDDKEMAVYHRNEIAYQMTGHMLSEYKAILNELKNEEDTATDNKQPVVGQKYLEYQLAWFGKTYDAENNLTLEGINQAITKLNDFLDSYVDKLITKKEQTKFRDELTKLFDAAYGRQDKNKDRIYGKGKITEIFTEHGLGYEIKTVSDKTVEKKTDWIVKRINRE